MRIRYVAKTDVGMKRNHNEDYFTFDLEEHLFLVADGMGGHSSGEVASKMAAETIVQFFKYSKGDQEATWPYKMDPSMSYQENRFVVSVKLANYKIFQAQATDLKYKGMGTTVVAFKVLGDTLLVVHVGDSRAYRLRDGKLNQVTVDHSLLEEYRQAKKDVTEEELRNFPHKNVITRALGMRENVAVDIQKEPILPGDCFLLCSDGLSGMVPDKQMEELMMAEPVLENMVNALVNKANENGGNDNVSVVILKFEP